MQRGHAALAGSTINTAPVPDALAVTAANRAACLSSAADDKCAECYVVGQSSWLDVLTGGCKIFFEALQRSPKCLQTKILMRP